MVKKTELIIREDFGPPSSAPMFGLNLLYIKTAIQRIANIQKISTEKPSDPAGTRNLSPLEAWYIAARDQAHPIPRKTLTELEPVTFPMLPSAYSSWTVAVLLANVFQTLPKISPPCLLVL